MTGQLRVVDLFREYVLAVMVLLVALAVVVVVVVVFVDLAVVLPSLLSSTTGLAGIVAVSVDESVWLSFDAV